jgi:hypothetical protein
MELYIEVNESKFNTAALTNIVKAIWYSFKVKHVVNTKHHTQVPYVWHQIMCIALHFTETSSAIIICLDLPRPVQKKMEAKLTSTNWNDSLAFHPILLLAVRELYDDSVWALRDLVRDAERQRTIGTPTSIGQPDFVHLHELARHVIHSNEVLDLALSTAKSLENRCREFAMLHCSSNLASDYDTDIRDEFEYMENNLRAIKRRSSTLHERLQNEIQLVRSTLQLYSCYQNMSPDSPL